MAAKRDPWQPIGDAIYYAALAAAAFMGPIVHRRGTLTNHHQDLDPEPEYRHCQQCGHCTIWEPYRWVIEDDHTWECVDCGSQE